MGAGEGGGVGMGPGTGAKRTRRYIYFEKSVLPRNIDASNNDGI